jgi:DNA-binding SARP family transcriptional activator
MTRRGVSAFFKAAVVVIVLAAIPFGLARLGFPSVAELRTALSLRWMSDRLALGLAGMAGWAAWIGLVASTLADGISMRRGQPTRSPGWLTPLTRRLGVAMFMLALRAPAVAATAGAPAPQAITLAVATHPLSTTQSTAGDELPTTRNHVVVTEGECLWDIAEDYYGNGLGWRAIAAANAKIRDPRLIFPGQILVIPPWSPDQAPPAVSHDSDAPPAPPSPADARSAGTSRGLSAAPRVAISNTNGSGPARAVLTRPGRPTTAHARPGASLGGLPVAAAPPAPSSAPHAHSANGVVAHDPRAEHWRGALGALGAGLLAVGVLTELRLRRRRRLRTVTPGRRILLPTGRSALVERRLAHSADVDGLYWVDLGLRRLRLALRAAKLEPGCPTVTGVRLSTTKLIIEADSPTPPAPPFVAKDSTWQLSRTALGSLGSPVLEPTPTPCLVTIGRNDANEIVLVNLEAHGVVAVSGDPAEAAAAVRAMAVELATAPWAEYEELQLVGVAAELNAMLRVNTHSELTDELIAELARTVEAVEAELAEQGWASLAQARLLAPIPGERAPMMVVIGPDQDIEPLSHLLGRQGLVVVRSGEMPAAWVLRASNGRLVVAEDQTSVQAQTVSEAEAAAIGELLAQAESEDEIGPTEPPYDAIGPREVTLAEAAAPDVGPGIALLGAIELSPRPSVKPPIKALELLAYLACHPEGVTKEIWQTALWRDGVSDGHRRNTLLAANKAVGPGVIIQTGSQFRLAPGFGCDWARFRALATGSPAQLRQALELVRGRPFGDLDSLWERAEGHATEMEQHIIAVALSLGESYLAAGDHEAVEWACKVALGVSPYDERIYRLRMRSAAGNRTALEGIWAQLKAAAAEDEDYDSMVEPETIQLYRSCVGARR